MRARTVVCLLACCCAALAGCTTAQASKPATAVKAPSVGKPPAPASAQAALSSEAFTPYAALGISSNDGLAPGESQYALAEPCMDAAGYPEVGGVSLVPLHLLNTIDDGILFVGGARVGAGLSFTQPWGPWGYLGTADAQQYGFRAPLGAALATLGITLGTGAPPTNPPTVPAAEQEAASKCSTITQDFATAVDNGPLAGIGTLGNDIDSDMQHDPAVHAATTAWSACMARNGYSFGSPQNVFAQEMQAIGVNATVSAAANQAQLAAAVTDANCTEASDLAGIYFAVQASYEQQLVSANREALATAVSQYRAAYAKELNRLPALLRTTKARPFGLRTGLRTRPGSS